MTIVPWTVALQRLNTKQWPKNMTQHPQLVCWLTIDRGVWTRKRHLYLRLYLLLTKVSVSSEYSRQIIKQLWCSFGGREFGSGQLFSMKIKSSFHERLTITRMVKFNKINLMQTRISSDVGSLQRWICDYPKTRDAKKGVVGGQKNLSWWGAFKR